MALTPVTSTVCPYQNNFTTNPFGPPPLESVLMPVGVKVTDLEFSIGDIVKWSYENFGCRTLLESIHNAASRCFSRSAEEPTPSCSSPATFSELPIFAESTMTTPGSKIYLTPTLASKVSSSYGWGSFGMDISWEEKLGIHWEKQVQGSLWKYVGTIQDGIDTYHQFALPPHLSCLNGDKYENLIFRNKRKFPAIFECDSFTRPRSDRSRRHLKSLGFDFDPKNELFQVPSLKTLIKKWDELRLERPELPAMSLILSDGTETDVDFVSYVIDGGIPISTSTEHDHDISAHLMPQIELMTRLKPDEVALYQKTKASISAILRAFLEPLKGHEGRAMTDKVFDQYLEMNPSAFTPKLSEKQKEHCKVIFHTFCLKVIGVLTDGSTIPTLFSLINFKNRLTRSRERIFELFEDTQWDDYLGEICEDKTLYKLLYQPLFINELLPMIKFPS